MSAANDSVAKIHLKGVEANLKIPKRKKKLAELLIVFDKLNDEAKADVLRFARQRIKKQLAKPQKRKALPARR
ncbi:MAG: hypothetical protein KF758_07565 [Anaerolineales bacterium]|nr:hypothetical protein [Anaerolineales bacterium]